MYDILIKNGIIFDGTGRGHGVRADIAISGGKIEAVKDMPSATAKEAINAEGLYVAPGFIDIQNHSDSHGQFLIKPGLESLVAQGVTTVVIGQCGASLAPLPVPEAMQSLQKWGTLEGVNADWQTFREFRTKLFPKVFGTNILSFVGHATLRRSLTGDSARQLTPDEIRQEAKLLAQALGEGARGVSFGFQYGHEIKTTGDEILALLEVVKEAGKIWSVHLQNEGEKFLDSVRTVTDWAKRMGVKTKVSHFKVEGKKNYDQLYPSIQLIEQTYQAGADIRFDLYPYTTTWRPLYTYLPVWAYEGGFKPMLARLADKNTRLKILGELGGRRASLGELQVSSSPKVPIFVGKTVAEISKSQNIAVEEALLRVLSGNYGQAVVFDHDLNPEQITVLLKHPLSLVGSDAVGYPLRAAGTDAPHPRCFGTFTRFLRLLRGGDQKPIMSWSEGVAKLTGNPASYLGLTDRGIIKAGLAADIVIFDPSAVSDSATYENPYRPSAGLRYVINNGKLSLFEGQLTGIIAGKVL